MQDKMASRSRALDLLYQVLFRVWVPIFGWSVTRLPLGLLYRIGDRVMLLFLALNPRYRRALHHNFSRILGEREDAPRVRETARAMARHLARYWIDFFYWSERGGEAAQGAVVGVENRDALARCLAGGRGALLLTAHLGNWEMGGLLLERSGVEVAVVYVPDRFKALEAFRSRYRRRAGVTEIPLRSDPLAPLPVLRVLRSGGVVAVQGDRDFDNTGHPVPFFGETAWFPRGPARLALISGAPILPVFILREKDGPRAGSGGFRVHFFDPIEPVGDARSPEALDAIVRRTAGIIEAMVRSHPEQWYCFYPFWDDPSRRRQAPIAVT
jgi:lauroyl/myristoyl acyltransferase